MTRVLIINADDLGYDPAVTRGILEAMRNGVVTSATFMVNTPFSEEAARASSGLALGLHLNLARGAPVSAAFPSELLHNGAFDEARAAELPAAAVQQEALAQLDRFEVLHGRPATHVDVHKHLHTHHNVLTGLIAAAKARDLPVRSTHPGMRARLQAEGVKTNDHFIGDAGAEAYWTWQRVQAHLVAIEDGVTELMCHPGYTPTHVKSGYSGQRELERATLTDPRVRKMIELSGVALADWTVVTAQGRRD
jgi:chitin disaccharide deacetylase